MSNPIEAGFNAVKGITKTLAGVIKAGRLVVENVLPTEKNDYFEQDLRDKINTAVKGIHPPNRIDQIVPSWIGHQKGSWEMAEEIHKLANTNTNPTQEV